MTPGPRIKEYKFLIEVTVMAGCYEKALERFKALALNKHDKTYNSYVRVIDKDIEEPSDGKGKRQDS